MAAIQTLLGKLQEQKKCMKTLCNNGKQAEGISLQAIQTRKVMVDY